jgi:hypothetical protein
MGRLKTTLLSFSMFVAGTIRSRWTRLDAEPALRPLGATVANVLLGSLSLATTICGLPRAGISTLTDVITVALTVSVAVALFGDVCENSGGLAIRTPITTVILRL